MGTLSKLCVIAAAGPGMGLAIGKRFAREGYDIALIARSASSLSSLQAELARSGTRVTCHETDLCDLNALKATFAAIRDDIGDPEVLVYNGGAWHEVAAMEVDPDLFSRDLMLCVTGALACAQQVFPAMKRAGRGTILFTGGGLALHPEYGVGVSSLAAGKSGLRGLTYALAGEVAPAGVHVATVTIAGTVKPGTPFDPDTIADAYWALHVQRKADWVAERVFGGD